MFGRHYFDHRDWIRRYDRDFTQWQHGLIAGGRDFAANPVTQAERDAVYMALLPDYTIWLRRNQEVEEQRAREQEEIWKNIPELNIRDLQERVYDQPKMKPFKLPYDTLQEMTMRFRQSVIQIKGHPYYVSDVRKVKERFYFLVEDCRDQKSQVCASDIPSFRGVPPGYVTIEGQHGFMARQPARVNQQGMTPQNTTITRVSTDGGIPFNQKGLVTAIESKSRVLPWIDNYRPLMENRIVPEMRLSDEVAIFTKKGQDPIYIGYKGRVFGKLRDGNFVSATDEDDLVQPWIGAQFRKVNLEVVR